MKEKKEIEFALLIFAITTIIYTISFACIIGKVDRDYQIKIEKLKKDCK